MTNKNHSRKKHSAEANSSELRTNRGVGFSTRFKEALADKRISGNSYQIGKQLGINAKSIDRYLNGTMPRKYDRVIELGAKLDVKAEWLATGLCSDHEIVLALRTLPEDGRIAMTRAIYLLADPETNEEITAVMENHQPLKDKTAFLADVEKVWNVSKFAEQQLLAA